MVLHLEQVEKRHRVFCHSRYDGAPPYTNHLSSLQKNLESRFEISATPENSLFLAIDHDARALRRAKKASIPIGRRILFVREPKQVHPYSHSRIARGNYGQIHYMGFAGEHISTTLWPYDIPKNFEAALANAKNRENKVVAVASWRISFIKGSLYGLRAKAFHNLEIDLYGRGWGRGIKRKTKEIIVNLLVAARHPSLLRITFSQITNTPKNYFGEVDDKAKTISKYKVALVIENSLDYFSEKLYDALYSGTIPVYCGPSPDLMGIPKSLVFQSEPNLRSLSQNMTAALAADYEAWRELLLEWINETKIQGSYLSENVWAKAFSELGSIDWNMDRE